MIMGSLIGWCGALLGFGFLVLIHECGHFFALKLAKLPVFAFSIGFGSPIWKISWRETEWRLGWIPFGGYVMPEDPEVVEKREAAGEPLLNHNPPLSSVFVAIMGPVANFALAFVLFALVTVFWGEPRPVPVVETAMKGSPAQVAGLIGGDRLLSFNDKALTSWSDLIASVQQNGMKPAQITVGREGKTMLMPITPLREGERFVIGIRPRLESAPLADPVAALQVAATRTVSEIAGVCDALRRMFSFAGASNVSGPVAIMGLASDAARGGLVAFFSFLAVLSINLGVFNLLPIPPLDGLRILISCWHFLFGKPPRENLLIPVYQWGALGLALLFLIVTIKDLGSLF
jgi:regulator of sigma E protease